MANVSYLYSSAEAGPPDPESDQEIATGRYLVPAFWIAPCKTDDLKTYVDEDDEEMPYVSLPSSKALAQFEANRSSLEAFSPDFAKYYDEWVGVLSNLGDAHLKIDPSEVIFMTDEDDGRFKAAIQFFEEINESTVHGLLHNACLTDILDANDAKKLVDHAVVNGQVTEVSAADYLMGVRV